MKKNFRIRRAAAPLGLAAALALTAIPAFGEEIEKTPAFPGAEGYGRYTTGGRGGSVYHVTNLNDSGEGSLRWALSQTGPRTIVFDVSGTIHLLSSLRIPENTTIAGQTAPGDGICLADYPVSLGANNIIRYMRFRLGNTYVTQDGADGWDGLSAMDSHDIIVDHCSVSWSIDECCSILGNVNTTLQWTLVAQSLVNSGHSKGAHGYGGNWGGTHASFHHNLLTHHTSRTPRLGPRPTTQENEIMDMRNNVMYNYGNLGCYGGEGMNVNIVNNYYRRGPASPTSTNGKRIAGVGIRTEAYCKTYPAYAPMLHVWGTYFVDGNMNHNYADVYADNWNNGFYNQIKASDNDGLWNDEIKEQIHLYEPIDFVATTTHPADVAYQRVLDYVGASLKRDSFDALMVDDVNRGRATYTGSGLSQGYVNSQNDNKPYGAGDDWNAWPELESLPALPDTDGDGIPDEWELANGLDPNKKADGNTLNAEGYTMLEVYMNSLVEHITEAQNAGGELLGEISYADPVQDEYVISVETNTGTSTVWAFPGDIRFYNEQGGSYEATSTGYLRMGRDYPHTLTLPLGAEIYAVKVTGKGRYSAAQLGNETGNDLVHLVEINGETIAQGEKTLPNRTAKPDGEFTHTLANPARQTMTMTFAVNNPDISEIVLYAREATGEVTGIGETVLTPEEERVMDENWYNLHGMRVAAPDGRPTEPGIYIHKGRKVAIR